MSAFLAVFRALARYWRAHPLQVALTLAGIALGVAVSTGIRLANSSALEAFARDARVVSGPATHRVFDPSGAPVAEDVATRLALLPEVDFIVPVLESRAWLGEPRGEPVRVIGVDLAAGQAFPGAAVESSGAGSPDWDLLSRFIGEPGTALVSPALAERIGWQAHAPARLTLWHEGRTVTLEVLDRLALDPDSADAAGLLVLVDPATFQESFGGAGLVNAIELTLPDDATAQDAVRTAMPERLALEPIGSRTERVATMARAFQTNLEALGLFTLLVAVFLIFNAANFAVVQRGSLIARLRCLGARGGTVLSALLAEAALLGLLGGALGVALGLWLARVMVAGTSATVFELILLSQPAQVHVQADAGTWGLGLGLGVGAALVAAALPALEGARVAPIAALRVERGTSGGSTWRRVLLVGGLLTLAAGAALAWPEHGPLWAALLAATLIAAGGALLVPVVLPLAGTLAAAVLGRLLGAPGRLAGRNLSRSVSRTGLATASLMIALSLWLAIAVTVGSFRTTFELWLDQAVRAEVYVAPTQGVGVSALPDALVAALAEADWVADLDILHRRKVVLGGREVMVVGIDIEAFRRHAAMPMPNADPDAAYAQVAAGDALVSETLAYPLRVTEGDSLPLPTDRGTAAPRIAAVVQNYSAPSGIVYLHRARFLELYPGEPPRSAALWLAPGVSFAEAERRIAALPGGEAVYIQPHAELRGNALRVFDRTFAITALMRSVAGLVAFVAVVSALMALLRERRRMLGYLRAIGLSRRMLALSLALEAALIACVAALMSWGVGVAMAYVLIHVVNRRAFGWTLQYLPDEGPYAGLLAVALGAALLGALFPIVQAARLSVIATIREE